MAFSRVPIRAPILTAKAANGVGTSLLINDYQNINLQLTTSGNTTATVKIQGSFAPPTAQPDFSSAASATNPWGLVESYELASTTSAVAGATGYVFSGTDGVKNILVNTNGLTWLNVVVSGYSAGSINVTGVLYNNQ